MAVLVSPTGSFTFGASSWLQALTSTNALQTDGTTNSLLSTTPTGVGNITGAGETVTALGLRVSSIASAGISGVTLSVRVRNATDNINNDFTYSLDSFVSGAGWVFLTLGAGVVLTAGKTWVIQLSASTASRIGFTRTATTGDWNRVLVTTSTGTPANSDSLWVGGRVSTSPSTTTQATASYEASLSLALLQVTSGGIVNWQTNSLTMTVSGNVTVNSGGQLLIGTSSSGISGELRFPAATAAQYGLIATDFATVKIFGSTIASKYVIPLASTANSGQNTITLAEASGWSTGQQVLLTSTQAQASSQVLTISSVSSANVTFTGNLTAAADVRTRGTHVTVSEAAKACLLTRGFLIDCTGAGSWFSNLYGPNTIEMREVFWRGAGGSGTGGEMEVSSPGTASVTKCSFLSDLAVAVQLGALSARLCSGYTISECIFASPASNLAYTGIGLSSTFDSNTSISKCIFGCRSIGNTAHISATSTHGGNVEISECEFYGGVATRGAVDLNSSTSESAGEFLVRDSFFGATYNPLRYRNYAATGPIAGSVKMLSCNIVGVVNANCLGVWVSATSQFAPVFVESCKFLGVRNVIYQDSTSGTKVIVSNCQFENLTIADNGVLRVNTLRDGFFRFEGCSFWTSNTPAVQFVTSPGSSQYNYGVDVKFVGCSFTGITADSVLEAARYPVLGARKVAVERCSFGGTSSRYREEVQGGTITTTTSTFSGSGACLRLIPLSTNPAYEPMSSTIVLPTLATSFTVSFKAKHTGLNGTVTARVLLDDEVFGTQSIDVTTSWADYSVSASGLPSGGAVFPRLVIALTGTTGLLDVDSIAVS